MEVLKWLALILLPFWSGRQIVRSLTAHPLQMSRHLLGATLAACAWLALLVLGFGGWEWAIAIPLTLLGAVAGYALMARAVLSRQDPRKVPALQRPRGDPGLGHTAVVYFTHGEPETYDPIGWINQFREFDAQSVPFVPLLIRPFFLYRLRQSYLKVGKSGHRAMHRQMLNSLERAYRAEGDQTTRFYLCFLDDDPRPDAALIQALNDGASRIIVSEVFLTISSHTVEGKELIEASGLRSLGVPISYTGPLYDSEMLKRMFVQRVNSHLGGTAKEKAGVLLVGHGQPAEWDALWPTQTEHETRFRQEVLARFVADGYRPENLGLAWMEFKVPRPAARVEEFAGNGVEKVFYFSAAISADAIHSQYDVPELVRKARVPNGFPLVNLGAWNDDPLVIEAIKEKIDAQMRAPAAR